MEVVLHKLLLGHARQTTACCMDLVRVESGCMSRCQAELPDYSNHFQLDAHNSVILNMS